MRTRTCQPALVVLVFICVCAIVCLGRNPALAHDSVAEFHKNLREKAAFAETDFTALDQGQTVVKLLPAQDKREVALCGLMRVQIPAEVFLQSFRESMVQKSNNAVLEIGSFSSTPTLADLQSLTIEDRDIEDLKECVVGNCKLKLSAAMIERFHQEVDWEAPDYRLQATHLLKLILLDYVRDYLTRGEVALIAYNDKPYQVQLGEEQRSLMAASSYLKDVLAEVPPDPKGSARPELPIVENTLVWSKIKFGLKPVIAINHILIYKLEQKPGAQIVVISKQIYANHYFDSSLALTVFGNIPGASPEAYLFYENRSRADGLEGPFGKIKRGIVERRAVDGLKAILEQSKATLSARALGQTESTPVPHVKQNWRRWTVGGVHLFLWLLLITGFVALLAFGNYQWKASPS